MTYETYRSIFAVAGIAGIVMAFVSIILFFRLKIPSVIGDLTGATARKGIAAIREGNIKSGNKNYSSSAVNLRRGKITAKMTPSGRLEPITEESGYGLNTQELTGNEAIVLSTTPAMRTGETTVLPQMAQTGETMVLPYESTGQIFEILQDITMIHTEETVE